MAGSYFSPRRNDIQFPYVEPSAGPSSSSYRRPAPRDAYLSYNGNEGRDTGADTDVDRFGDAETDVGRMENIELQEHMMGFQPAPPRAMPQPRLYHRYRSPQPLQPDPPPDSLPESSTPPSYPYSSPHQGTEGNTPPRERLPSSTSISSMSSAQRGRRAPVPAALDLSPKSEKVAREAASAGKRQDKRAIYSSLGYGMVLDSGNEGRRAVTDSYIQQNASHRIPRPLPAVPEAQSSSFNTSAPIPQSSSFSASHPQRDPVCPSALSGAAPSRPAGIPQMMTSPSMPSTAAHSAVGAGHMGRRGSSGRGIVDGLDLSVEDLAECDPYHPQPSPYSRTAQLSPVRHTIPPFSPTTPDMLDPASIDRRTLIGTGELATPRWGASTGHPHLRTPNMLQSLAASPQRSYQAEQLQVGSAPHDHWVRGETGLGLGVGVMGGQESGRQRDTRGRHHSAMLQTAPKVPVRKASKDDGRAPIGSNQGVDDLERLLSVGSLGDFDFDSSMAAALAASLSLTEEKPPSPPDKRRDHRQSAPPLQTTSRPLPQLTQDGRPSEETRRAISGLEEIAASQGSPGSARSRIYARRQERERQALEQQAGQPGPSIPQRSTSTFSPPDSADSQTFPQRSNRDIRKTPPGKERDPPRPRQSPTASHDILKHFAPKDFSHLPPSPSTASINQFLRGSGSVSNFASASSPPSIAMGTSHSYFSPTMMSTGPSKGSLQQSDSGRVLSMPSNQKIGLDGRNVDPDTAEAMRKLDGLSFTPGKAQALTKDKNSTGSGSIHSRPGTPPAKSKHSTPSHKKLSSKASAGSVKAPSEQNNNKAESPLNNWVDVAEDIPAVPALMPVHKTGMKASSTPLDTPSLPKEKRESSSSTSFGGTSASRDSNSVPTTSTTPSSLTGQKLEPKPVRRSSGDSDVSIYSDAVQGDLLSERESDTSVPPVPPLPKGYMSMRQGLSDAAGRQVPSYVPLREPEPSSPGEVTLPGELTSPSLSAGSETQPSRPRPMHKKWSFSSALSLRTTHKESSLSPAGSPPVQPSQDSRSSPETPWMEVQRSDASSPAVQRLVSSEVMPTRGNRSNHSVTPVASNLAAPKPNITGKRLTPSSIPFFRRISSTSVQSKESQESVPETAQATAPPPLGQRTPSGSQARRSVLGMHLPSMMRGSASKRGLSQQLEQAYTDEKIEVKHEKAVSSGWTGRKRGKTLSISADPPRKVSAPLQLSPNREENLDRHPLKPKISVEGSLKKRSSVQSDRSESTVNGTMSMRTSKSGLPPIAASPHIRHAPSSSSLKHSESSRDIQSASTKIPRLVNKATNSTANGSMAPPAYPQTMTTSKSANVFGDNATSRTMSHTSSMADFSRPSVNEFGAISSMSAPRHTTAGSHRAHLLAPMSSRAEPKREKVREPLVRKTETGGVVPPSRRNLPIPPSMYAAQTASSTNKQTSRDYRPGNSRHNSRDTGSGQEDARSASISPIKPSKSMHTNLSVPSTSRIPSSSSMGAPATFRHTSLMTEGQSTSPGEDEESQGDAEMQAYVARRRARRATASGKKDDLADITAFPKDVLPAEPISQRVFISRKLATMSDFERKEVLDYDQIYFTPSSRIIRPLQSGGASYNHGFDDERGDYLVVEGDHLCYRYEVVGTLGKGSFGQVIQCRDHMTGGSAAVKIIRNKKRFHAQALVEVKILQQLCEWDPDDKHYMVRMTDNFYFRGHLCIVTELLSINLYELIKANQFAGFSTILIRRFTSQILASLQVMRSHRIVHCDLKPENILLCHPVKSGIKTIDFGSSCLETEKVFTYIQSRFYRSPEVILGMNYAMAIDMWSLGCILAELYTGVPLFPGENENEQLACIMEVLGVPDRYIVEKASRRKLFFDATGMARPFVNGKGKRRRPGARSLAAVLRCDDDLFVDFIGKCLTWDPDKRLKPQPAMRHPWILAGRRRAAPAPTTMPAPNREEKAPSQISSPAQSRRTSARTIAELEKDREKGKQLLISPPTPLMARQSYTSRVVHSRSNSRMIPSTQITTSSLMVGSG